MEGLDTQFDFSFAPGTSLEQIIGFEMAGEIWSHYLKDDVTLNIYVETTSQLPENVIGGALPGIMANQLFTTFQSKLTQDITTANDSLAVNNLHDGDLGSFNVMVQGNTIKANRAKAMNMTRANAKALGIVNGNDPLLDGYIVMSNLNNTPNIAWDYNTLDLNVPTQSLDYLSVALHEVGHILGFVSGVDDPGWLNAVVGLNYNYQGKKFDNLGQLNNATPLDMFRHTKTSATRDAIDMSIGMNSYGDRSYFSINGGITNLGYFASGEATSFGGDGYQASHWQQSNTKALGIMDPVLKTGQRREISTLDATAMDAIGWNVMGTSQLNWQQLYNDAIVNAQTALIQDRTSDVQIMIDRSLIYKGRRGDTGSGGSWQVGLWQHIKFQTLDVEMMDLQPEVKISEISIDNYFSQFTSRDQNIQNQLEENSQDNTSGQQLQVEQVVMQLLENNEIIASESNTLDLNLLASLSLESLDEMFNLNEELYEELLVMPIN
jgi:hypothetical protein